MRLCGNRFQPVFNAPGARGFFGRPYWYYPIWRLLGLCWQKTSFAAKTTTLDARTGNMPLESDGDTPSERLPRSILVTPGSFLSGHVANAVSLSGPGVQFLLAQDVWQNLQKPFVLSFMAVSKTKEERMMEYQELRDILSRHEFQAKFALQLDFGCPNVGLPLESLRDEIVDMLKTMSKLGIPLIANFNPLVPAELLKELEDTGLCDGFWIANTIPYDHDDLGMRIFGSKVSPLLKRGLPIESAGGISGPACLKYTLSTIRQARALGVTLPIVAGNGIQSPLGVWRAWKVGADAVAVGIVAMLRPFMMIPDHCDGSSAVRTLATLERSGAMTAQSPTRITIASPFDAHVHLRRDEMLRQVAPNQRIFCGSVVMSNTDPPILTGADAERYHREIISAAAGSRLKPLTTIMLTPATNPTIINDAWRKGVRTAKLYPQGVTTGSAAGITDLNAPSFRSVLQEMEICGMILSIHGEQPGVPILSAEQAFLPRIEQIIEKYPNLPVVVEHLSTAAAIELVLKAGPNVAGTITAHHLLLTSDDVLGNDGETVISPWHYCKPVAKTPQDREALLAAALSGNPKFFFGSDSAPHLPAKKTGPNPAAGIFVPGEVALPLLTQIFEDNAVRNGFNDWRSQLEKFISLNGPDFYELNRATGTLTLTRLLWTVPGTYTALRIVPLWAGRNLRWKIEQATAVEVPAQPARERATTLCPAT